MRTCQNSMPDWPLQWKPTLSIGSSHWSPLSHLFGFQNRPRSWRGGESLNTQALALQIQRMTISKAEMGPIQSAGTLGEYRSGSGSKLCDSGPSPLGDSELQQQIHIPQPLGLGPSLFQPKPLVRSPGIWGNSFCPGMFLLLRQPVCLSHRLAWKAKS